ncbi:MAG TPA: ABC transporter permease [Anaerolineales bacterium]|nr:ABC transporter permease [Anaerolineales bacterium]
MKNHLRIATLMTPPALVLLVLFVIPLVVMAVFSFRAGTFGAQREIFTLDHYRDYLDNPVFHNLLLRSTWIALQTALFSVLLAYPLAYYLAFHAGAKRFSLLTLLLVPAWTSYLLRVLAWKIMLSSGGVFNTVMMALGLVDEAQPILLYSRGAVIVTLVYVWIPFVALPIYAALQRIDSSLLEAAADLGSPPWRSFLKVTVPLSLPGVLAGFFIVFIPSLGEWVTPQLVGGVTGSMYGNVIQDQFVRGLNWPVGALMSLVMLVFVLLFLLVFSRVGKLSDLAGV